MLGLTSIDLPFLGNLRSNWVVVIGIELLSLACPGLDLGSVMVQPLKIPKWKWEEIGIDFIVGLPRTQAGYDSIWLIVDRLTTVAHFIPVKMTYLGAKLAELYMSRIVCLHGVPKRIVSDRGSQFTSKFWDKLLESMQTKLNFS
jgi:hypothetical protein